MREPNITTQSLENQDHETSSSHVEPTNGIAPSSQTSHEAYASQHNEKLPGNNCLKGFFICIFGDSKGFLFGFLGIQKTFD